MRMMMGLFLVFLGLNAFARPVVHESYCEYFGDIEVLYADGSADDLSATLIEGHGGTTLEARNDLAAACARLDTKKCLREEWDNEGSYCLEYAYGTLRTKGTTGSIANGEGLATAKNRAFCRTLSRSNKVTCESN